MRFFTETFAAGETKQFAVRGGYLKIFSSTYAVDVNFYAPSGFGSPSKVATAVPAGFSYKPQNEEFSGVSIVSAQAQVVTFIIADGDTQLDRIIGEVSVIDGGKARTLANQAFGGYATQAAVAAQYSHVQLWNPVGSGKILVVEQVLPSSATAGGVGVSIYNAALTTFKTNPASKKSGGAASIAEIRAATNVGILGTQFLFAVNILASTTFPFSFEEPIVLLPGFGLNSYHGVVNVEIALNFDFYEEALT